MNDVRAAVDNAVRAADRCNELCDYLTANVPVADMHAQRTQLVEDRVLIDQIIAWVHGARRLPDLTPGAQAIKTISGTTNDPF